VFLLCRLTSGLQRQETNNKPLLVHFMRTEITLFDPAVLSCSPNLSFAASSKDHQLTLISRPSRSPPPGLIALFFPAGPSTAALQSFRWDLIDRRSGLKPEILSKL
jgi:hypothetical protein